MPEWVLALMAETKPLPSRPGVIVAGQHKRYSVGNHPEIDDTWLNKKGMAGFTVRCVCDNCNTGWMSDIENTAKPILVPMIRGQSATLDRPSQDKVAQWLALKAMVA